MQQQQRWFAYRRYAVSVVLISGLAIESDHSKGKGENCTEWMKIIGDSMWNRRFALNVVLTVIVLMPLGYHRMWSGWGGGKTRTML